MGSNRTTLWSTGRDESVEVNQRALIDKVLARYSGEFTVFRELLQNSDDAQSSSVEIHFETAEYLYRTEHAKQRNGPLPLPDLKSTHVAQWMFKNDGIIFRDEDWLRLRKIAEGNPDEEKIGAFGVGFYSLFSVTENPFVSSGGHAMQFYWKDNKDQLNVRRGDLPSRSDIGRWTTFEMTLREAGPIPSAFDLVRFLASSITFMVHINDVGVYFDEHRIGHIRKSTGGPKAVDLLATMKRTSQLNVMNIEEVQSRLVGIEATVMRAVMAAGVEKYSSVERPEPQKPKGGFFSVVSSLASQSTHRPEHPTSPPLEHPTELHKMNVTLTVFTAEVGVKVDEKLFSEILRSTKKRPPARLKYHLIYTGKEDYDQSLIDDKKQPVECGSIFQGLRADLNGSIHTRVFIGHATGQTTGIGGHMASHFIPTVERESIDFVDKNIAVWNKELLYVGGFLSRAAYDLELSNIHTAWANAAEDTPNSWPPRELQNRSQDRFLHSLKFFAFHHSTPSLEVGRLLESAFYGCSTTPLRMLSTTGVCEASAIKQYDPVFTEFLKGVPMLPQSVLHECPRTVKMLQDQGMISTITFSDVLDDLHRHQLNKKNLVSCLRWWIGMKQNNLDGNMRLLLDATVFRHIDGSTLQLSSVRYFVDSRTLGRHIPQDSPLPSSLLPQDVAEQFTFAELSSFGWQEFTAVSWLQHISQPGINPAYDFTRSPSWAARVLGVLSHTTSSNIRSSVKELLKNKKCIPTSHGQLPPAGAYLPGTSTGLFRNLELPIVEFPSGMKMTEEIETLLVAIGVRKHIDPQLLLNRMTESGNWNIIGLIRYLVPVRRFLTADEVTELASSAIFARDGITNDTVRYCARDLYAPTAVFRQLGLPVIRWDDKSNWLDNSDEAKLLFHLGLRRHPPLGMIVTLCSSEDAAVRATAFGYLCANLDSEYSNYDPSKFEHVAFIPAENNGSNHLGKPGDVFCGKQWKALGFSVIQDDYRNARTSKLGIQQHPPTPVLLSRLENTPPPDENTACQWFEILFEHISTFKSHELVVLSKLPIVPTVRSGVQEWLTPAQCYLGEGVQDPFYSKLFVFVNFGHVANRFLSACGSRNEPTVTDVAQSLVDDPQRFYELADGHENFLSQLRNLAVNKHRIPNMTLSKMKFASILLGKKAIGLKEWNRHTHELRSPKEIVIADDINAYRLFRDAVFIAPQEELLEDFYASLGCKRLSDVVQEQCNVVGEISDADTCSERRTLVLDRLTLFLYEYTYAKPKVSVDWLSKAENFRVRICKNLSISKTLAIGDDTTTRSLEASAGAKRVDKGRIELWLSRDAELDMYEVSTSLCRLLFGTAKVSESLLFTSILSEKLQVLRRRGCNVDLILKRHQLEQDIPNVDDEKRDDISAQEASDSSPSVEASASEPLQGRVPELETSMPSTTPTPHQHTHTLRNPTVERAASISSASMKLDIPQTRVAEPEIFTPSATLQRHHSTCASSSYVSLPEGTKAASCKSTAAGTPPNSHKHGPSGIARRMYRKLFPQEPSCPTVKTTVTSLQPVQSQIHAIPRPEIQATINRAIKACCPEEHQLRRDFSDKEATKEALSDRYCHDVSGQTDKLKRVGELPLCAAKSRSMGRLGTIQVFAATDVPNHDTFMASRHEPLNRFAKVITTITKVYKLPATSLNIFYDMDGTSIAFNRDGNLFLNLRYFEAWHDQRVAGGIQRQAQISWFFTLAHEIAHNVIKSHNSDHAFWFSNICEEHISDLVRILADR